MKKDYPSERYRFVATDQIKCLVMDIEHGQLYEWIGDHKKKIVQKNERQLIKMSGTGKKFSVEL